MKISSAAVDEDFIEREISHLIDLKSDFVIQYFDCFRIDLNTYIITEYYNVTRMFVVFLDK